MSNVLFYDDVEEFGGHEQMTVHAAKALAQVEGVQVSFMFFDRNARLGEQLAVCTPGEKAVHPVPIPYSSGRLQGIRTLASLAALRNIRQAMEATNPDTAVIAQGTIELSTQGLVAAKRAGERIISYIPAPHSLVTMGARFGAIRDRLNRRYYSIPHRFLTVSEGARCLLAARGVSAERVTVVRNGIDFADSRRPERSEARNAFGLVEGVFAMAVIGRILLKNKGQDVLVQALRRYRRQLGRCKAFVVGDGPDEARLRAGIESSGLSDVVEVMEWRKDLSSLYAALDVLVIPSRFEGVPLVMLEAMWHGLPVVASNTDGMADILPAEWLFRVGDVDGLGKTLLCVRESDNAVLTQRNKERVEKEFTLERFKREFCSAVLSP